MLGLLNYRPKSLRKVILLNLMEVTVDSIIDYVDNRKISTYLERWTRDQIKSFIYDHINSHTIRVAFGPDEEILGVIIFNPNIRGQFWVHQFFGGGAKMWELFLCQLQKEFPQVTEIWGLRRGNRFVKFNINTLLKLYGRRSSCTKSN